MSEDEADKIMRITLSISGNTLIANDVPKSLGTVSENENRFKIAVSTETIRKPTVYSPVSHLAAPLKCAWMSTHGTPTSACSGTSTASSGPSNPTSRPAGTIPDLHTVAVRQSDFRVPQPCQDKLPHRPPVLPSFHVSHF